MASATIGTLQRLSTPGPGRTLLGEAETRAAPLRTAVLQILADAGSSLENYFTLDFVDPFATASRPHDLRMRAAWTSVAMWLVGRLVGPLGQTADLAEGEEWFAGSARITGAIPTGARRSAAEALQGMTVDVHLNELLPYVLDPVGLGTRRAVLKDGRQATARASKKANGVYYTPSDVADYMLDCIAALEQPGGLVDPACGSGVFLRSALRRSVRVGRPIDAAAAELYGVDVSPWAIEMCAYVLVAEYLSLAQNRGSPQKLWRDFRSRLTTANSLYFQPSDSDWADSVRGGFRYVVANPPYAQVGEVVDASAITDRFQSLRDGWSSSTNAFIPFVELMWQLGSDESDSAMVVPLSIAYSSTRQVSALRRSMEQARGRWEFAFFDRTPDALFGDDVKQRCAIAIRHAEDGLSVATGPLQRWTSRTRSQLFASISFMSIDGASLEQGIPKLGSRLEADVYRSLRERQKARFAETAVRSLRCAIAEAPDDPLGLLIAGTAYNWISVLGDTDLARRTLSTPSVSPLLGFTFSSREEKWMAYALLSSRLIYWLWRVEGDAFHVPKGFIEGLPLNFSLFNLSQRRRLTELGQTLWKSICDRPIVSTNGGRETVTYCPYSDSASLDDIDASVIDALGLPQSFGEFLSQFVLRTTVVDFEDPRRAKKEGRALTGWVAV